MVKKKTKSASDDRNKKQNKCLAYRLSYTIANGETVRNVQGPRLYAACKRKMYFNKKERAVLTFWVHHSDSLPKNYCASVVGYCKYKTGLRIRPYQITYNMVREQVDAMMHTVNTQQQQQQQPTVVQTVNTGYSEEDRLPDNPLPTNLLDNTFSKNVDELFVEYTYTYYNTDNAVAAAVKKRKEAAALQKQLGIEYAAAKKRCSGS